VSVRSTSALIAALICLALAPPRARAETDGPVTPLEPLAPAPAPTRAPAAATALAAAQSPTVAVESARPLAAAAPEPVRARRVPLAKRWWFWASLGAAAVGVVLAALYLGPRDPYNGNALPGTVTVF
jgi:hypothetical protein